MNIDAVASQLRAVATVFGGNVAGAAAYANGVADQVWLPLPAAYVIPREEDAEPNDSWPGLNQIIRERISVIVVLSTPNAGGASDAADRRGQAAAAQLPTLRAAIFKALLNWQPPGANAARGIAYLGARFPEEGAFDRARFFYEFTFGLDVTITDADGWTVQGLPLVEVQGTITDGPGGATYATTDIKLPVPTP